MKKPAWLILCIITVVAGLALSATNMLTEEPIAKQQLLVNNAARIAVFPNADAFEEIPVDKNSNMDSVYVAKLKDATVGYVLQTTVTGYGGPIEIVIGIDMQGVIVGFSVGGSSFAETAGLGTRTREPAFTGQFIGLSEPPVLKQNIDAVSGATISSTAVTSGANRCYLYWEQLTGITPSVQPQDAATPATDAATSATTSATATQTTAVGATDTGVSPAFPKPTPATDATTGATATQTTAVGATATGASQTFPKPTPATDATTGATATQTTAFGATATGASQAFPKPTTTLKTDATTGATATQTTAVGATATGASQAFPKPTTTLKTDATTGATATGGTANSGANATTGATVTTEKDDD